MRTAVRAVAWLARAIAIILLVIVGSTVLVRYAPGYLSDAREMDARYADTARAELSQEALRSRSLWRMLASEASGWLRADGGVSRQFGIPVVELVRPRLAVTGLLLLKSIVLAWMIAAGTAILSSTRRRSELYWQIPATLLLSIPTAAMATLCLLGDCGGPVLVMAVLLAVRDFKFLHRTLHKAWLDPCALHARAQGIAMHRLLGAHILPAVSPQLLPLASLSMVTALSAIVPVEVIFNVPGLGQLAWSAAMNRDLPVLLSVTALMALAVTCAGLGSERSAEWKTA